ncbi:hypothetical protein Vadar_028830 [Vaccinium darrowii]|uniref:Uncharacterized protein n=1 Tax=Vaccinium darrowii TaxID=229202 RepID=A0ACB7YRK9_9ERIC|nr:hypothetical protein Vadar_028830 [Vaccinium darrowii]
MATGVTMIKDIRPGQSNWTAEVMVIEKGFPRLTQNKKLYQKLVFIDAEDETNWIQVMCKVVDYNQKFYYMSCSKCIKGTTARGNTPFWCSYCKQRLLPMPRCKFNIELSDSIGIIVATLFGEKAESMFSIDGEYLRENIQQDQLSDVAMEKLGTGIEYAVQVRAYKYEAREVALCLFNVKAFFPTNEIIEDILQLTLEPETP